MALESNGWRGRIEEKVAQLEARVGAYTVTCDQCRGAALARHEGLHARISELERVIHRDMLALERRTTRDLASLRVRVSFYAGSAAVVGSIAWPVVQFLFKRAGG